MVIVRLTQLNLETPVTQEFANNLSTSAESVQTLDERITTVSYVRVTYLNLEVPVAVVASETLTNVGTSEQTMLETITGTPVQEQFGTAPSAWVGGAVRNKETIVSISKSEQTLDERISESLLTSAISSQSIDTFVKEKLVYVEPARVSEQPISVVPVGETVKFDHKEKEIVVLDDSDTARIKRRQKEEDELVLLGILG